MQSTWHVIRITILVAAFAYVALVIYAYPHDHQQRVDQAAVAQIEAQKLTLDSVDGTNFPPEPDPAENNATIAGVDANGNGIRDDVELAIFAKYPASSPTSTVIRAAQLQYAKELQLEFTSVFDSATLVAVMRQEGRGYMCIPTEADADYVESLVFNTVQRRQFREGLYKKYMTSFSLETSDFCDLSI